MKLRFGLSSFLVGTLVLGAGLGLYASRWKFDHEWENRYELEQRVKFLGFDCRVLVCAEEGADGPSWRQRRLLSKILRDPDPDVIDDAADAYLNHVDDMVGLAEYGLGHINRGNIRDHYGISCITIPRQAGSPDDYVVLDGGCDWEEEHGLQLLIKNGRECVSFGGYEMWERQKPWERQGRLVPAFRSGKVAIGERHLHAKKRLRYAMD